MNNRRNLVFTPFGIAVALIALAVPAAQGQFSSGSDGSDGPLEFIADPGNPDVMTIDLSLAAAAPWQTPSPDPGKGVYDAEKWAVVFKYTTIDLPAGKTVYFENHPKGAPVVWLAQADVNIAATVKLNGFAGSSGSSYAQPGPGGFAGGREGAEGGAQSSGGFGPGGAQRCTAYWGPGGGYGSAGGGTGGGATYGNPSILPLIGGSGGSAGWDGSGGAGGGAILIASSTSIILDGAIRANGGQGGAIHGGGGSGGAIRLVANTISGSGSLRATGGVGPYSGGNGGNGRIRMEAGDLSNFNGSWDPWPSTALPGEVFPPSTAPTLRVTQIAGQAVPADPDAGIGTVDVNITEQDPVTVHIEAMNIPPGWPVQVRIVRQRGNVYTVDSTPLVGSFALSTATAEVTFSLYRSEIQLRVNWTP